MSTDPFNDPDNWDEWGYKPAQPPEYDSEEDEDEADRQQQEEEDGSGDDWIF